VKPSKALVHAQPRWGSRIICISSITATSSDMKQKHNTNNIQLKVNQYNEKRKRRQYYSLRKSLSCHCD